MANEKKNLSTSGSQPLMAYGPLLKSLNTSGISTARKLAVAIPKRLKTKLKCIFPEFLLKTKKKKRSSSQIEGVFPKFSLKNTHKKKVFNSNRRFFFFKFSLRDFPEFSFTFMTKISISSSKVQRPPA